MYSSTNCDRNRGSCVNTLFLNQDKECFCYLPKGLSFPIRVKTLPTHSPRPLTCLLPPQFAFCNLPYKQSRALRNLGLWLLSTQYNVLESHPYFWT